VPGPTPHYPPEFKREAVELYLSSLRSIPKVAQELGIADESLRRWIRQPRTTQSSHTPTSDPNNTENPTVLHRPVEPTTAFFAREDGIR
jgi:transposase